jgi:hypothetical protein
MFSKPKSLARAPYDMSTKGVEVYPGATGYKEDMKQ